MSDEYFPKVIATGTHPGQARVVDVLLIVLYSISLSISLISLQYTYPALRREPSQCCSWCLVPGRLGHNCPFYAKSGVVNI